ncbi:MAP3K12-binding inhibitory protein 1 [Erpetoichthys calabaricus]|uniref:MAP3K12 binding inhibitory protein 1 n=1 Tax=Erpetoichthys calabaricus TaxID=27687 RepID=A0A8C4SZ48_ERPCA|nr:MAP3K12-binding inhibitory protein 1 [Erpetoichthys calabaricus]
MEVQESEEVVVNCENDSGVVFRESLCAILTSLTNFQSKLNLPKEALKVEADPSKLPTQLASQPLPSDVLGAVEEHILSLQNLTEKLRKLQDEIPQEIKPETDSVCDAKIELNTDNDQQQLPKPQETSSTEQADTNVQVNSNIVQIKAGKSEIERRIRAFIERKQIEINENNIREFCNVIDCNQENSCARTDAVFTPYPGYKSHIKVSRVVNSYGPQTRNNGSEERGEKSSLVGADCGNPAVEERLQNLETHSKLRSGGPVPLDIYQRLKRLEDRVLELEGLSPEYFLATSLLPKRQKIQPPQTYSLTELDGKINALKATLMKKVSESLSMETGVVS